MIVEDGFEPCSSHIHDFLCNETLRPKYHKNLEEYGVAAYKMKNATRIEKSMVHLLLQYYQSILRHQHLKDWYQVTAESQI